MKSNPYVKDRSKTSNTSSKRERTISDPYVNVGKDVKKKILAQMREQGYLKGVGRV